jgi:hypothetical protein
VASFGKTSRCTGAFGAMSRIARSRSFSNTMSAGISRATMRSKMLGSVDMPLA